MIKNHRLHYLLVIKPKNRHIYFRVMSDYILVKSPYALNKEEVSRLLMPYLDKIFAQINNNYLISGQKENYIALLGVCYRIKVIKDLSLPYLCLQGFFCIPSYDNLDKCLISYYGQYAKQFVLPALDKWSNKMGLYPKSVSFKAVKSYWGVCRGDNRVSFNIYLAQLPIAVIDYLVVHELAHIKHKNHSHFFWQEVAYYMPDYKKRRLLLKQLEKKLPLQ